MRIICKLPNASELINGVRFFMHEAGMISEQVASEVGDALLAVPGYFLHQGDAVVPAQASGTTGVEVDLDALRAKIRAEVLAEQAAAAPAPAVEAPAAVAADAVSVEVSIVPAPAADAPAADAATAPATKAKRTAADNK